MNTEKNVKRCDYCSNVATSSTSFMSGEPVSICDNESCRAEHQMLADGEHDEFVKAGLLPSEIGTDISKPEYPYSIVNGKRVLIMDDEMIEAKKEISKMTNPSI